jgi:N6-adenosine-specific RNA methylase IME4
MSVDELCALSVAERAADDAVLFLWATAPLLPESLRVAASWSFEYKALFVWDKVRHNFGHYNSVRAELLLLCTRGSCLPDSKELHDNVVSIERTDEHSEKPEEFRRLIDGLYTWGPRLELFARSRRDGWVPWGNEV